MYAGHVFCERECSLVTNLGSDWVLLMDEFGYTEGKGKGLWTFVFLNVAGCEEGVSWFGVACGWKVDKTCYYQRQSECPALPRQYIMPRRYSILSATFFNVDAWQRQISYCSTNKVISCISERPRSSMTRKLPRYGHLWAFLGFIGKEGTENITNDLKNTLVYEWNMIPNDVIRRYVRSMRSRMRLFAEYVVIIDITNSIETLDLTLPERRYRILFANFENDPYSSTTQI